MSNQKPIYTKTTIEELRDEVRASGSHWFDANTLRFFRSRMPRGPMNITGSHDDRYVYFVSSEQFDNRSPRRFSVRRWDRERKTMDTIGEFQAHGTELEAQKAMYAAVDTEKGGAQCGVFLENPLTSEGVEVSAKNNLIESAKHWELIALQAESMAQWNREHGLDLSDSGCSTGDHQAAIYRRTAEVLVREAETGKPHCSECMGDHPNHLHQHFG